MSVERFDLRFFLNLRHQPGAYIIEWCQLRDLIPRRQICPTCGRKMQLLKSKQLRDGYQWRCRADRANHTSSLSIRRGSWFATSSLNIADILTISYLVLHGVPSHFIESELQLTRRTVGDWACNVREICLLEAQDPSYILGGPGKTVEIHECEYGKRKKQGIVKWYIGGIERESEDCFFEEVETRDPSVLRPIISKHIHPKTTIVPDGLASQEDQLFTLDDDSPVISTCRNNIQGMWLSLKKTLPARMGENQFSSYVAMYRWIKRNGRNFEKFLEAVRRHYPVDD